METAVIVKVAVSAAPYSIDKPYDYWVPEPFLASSVKRSSLSVLCWTENRYWIRMELPWPSGCASGISAHCLRL